MTILFIYILSFLYSSDTIRHAEILPIDDPKLLEKMQPKSTLIKENRNRFLSDEFIQDERVIFSSYFCGSGDDFINHAAFDSQGNIIQVGYTGSPDLPMVGNSFQNEKKLNFDMFISKWSPEGKVLWSTFLGGSGADYFYQVHIDSNDDIILCGRTESPDIIVSEDAHQNKYAGTSDFYLAKFTKDGNYEWSTYLGGKGKDIQCRIVLDKDDNIYFGGVTSSNLLPTNENSFQRNLDKVDYDGLNYKEKFGVYLSKFTKDGQQVWGSYLATKTIYYRHARACLNDFISGIDVFEDEIAINFEVEEYDDVTNEGEGYGYIITEDAEQKEGYKSGEWQNQVIKLDTSGTTLKYATFYTSNYIIGKGVYYDSKGNLYLAIIGSRIIPKKNEGVFEEKGGLVQVVKYNTNNELEWDIGIICGNYSGGGIFYVDDNDILWFLGKTTCKEVDVSENNFPSKIEKGEVNATDYLFSFNLKDYSHWISYLDILMENPTTFEAKKNQIIISGFGPHTFVKNAFQSENKQGFNNGITLKLDLRSTLKVKDLDNKDNFIVFPNPTTNTIQINNIKEIQNLQITDLQGKKYIEINNPQKNEIDLSSLAVGIYYLTINHNHTFKIIKN